MKSANIIKKTGISVVIIWVVLLLAGVLYTYVAGGQAKPVPVPKAKTEVAAAPLKPPKPAANAREGVAVGAFTTPVTPGSNVSLQVHTNPTSTCKISLAYNGAPATDSGLTDKLADDYGIASWSWTVPASTPYGTYPVHISCMYNGQTGVLETSLVVNQG